MVKNKEKAAKTDIKIPIRTKVIGSLALFSIRPAMSKIGTKTDTNSMYIKLSISLPPS